VGSWTGTGPVAYTYQWESCDASGEECSPIAYATGQTYALESGSLETTLRVVVTAMNSAGSASATSAASTDIEPGAPSELEAPSIAGPPNAGAVLHAEAGVWGGTDVDVAIQWQLCNPAGASCTDISGATQSEYEPTEGDIGDTLRISVSAGNELGTVTAISPATSAIGEAFTLTNSSPPTVSGTPQSGSTLTAGHGSWSGSGTIGYAYQWQACDQSGADCLDIAGATNSTYILSSEDVNTAVRVVVTASDANGSLPLPSAVTQPIASASHPVVSVPPSITGTDQEGHTLTAHSGEWSGAGTITYAYQWESCDESGQSCAEIAGATTSTYLLSTSDMDSTIRVVVTATGSGGASTGLSAATEPIAPAMLIDTAVPAISGSQWSGQTLSAEPGLWEASSSIEYAYQWMRCDTSAQSCASIPGATGSTYALGEEDVGHTVEVDVTATGTWGEATVPSDPTGVIAPLPSEPENTSEPTIPAYANEGETISAETGSWAGTEPMTYTYQWQRCDEECSNISGATSSTHLLSAEDVGDFLVVSVTATNAAGSVSANSNATEEIGSASTPAATAAPTIYGTARDQQLLVAERGEWSGAQPIEHSYQWERCNTSGASCTDIGGATGQVYGVVGTDIGSTLRVRETASNRHGSASSTSAATGVVSANPASGPAPTVTGSAYRGNTLTAHTQEVLGTSPVETTYQWRRCNTSGASCTNIGGATESTYTLAEADTGSTIRVVATYTNAYGTDGETSSPTATIQDAAPSYASGLNITRSTEDFTVPGVVLTVNPGSWNGSATITYTYQWQRCNSEGASCTNISGATSAAYTVSEGDEEKHLRVIVSATNTHGTASETYGAVNVRVPHVPTVTSNPTVSGTLEAGQTLTASSQWIWNPTSITYQWQRCNPQWMSGWAGTACTNISGASSQTYTLSTDDDGFDMRILVTGSNTLGSNTWESSRTAAVHAVAPLNTELPAISGEAIVGAPLEATPGTWTGTTNTFFTESPTYQYQWQLCNAEGHSCHDITGAKAGIYTPPTEDLGLTVRVLVTATSPLSWTPSTRASATATSTVTATLGAATAAANTSAPTLSGTAEDGQTLSAAHGTWTGSPTIEYTYQWRRCNSEGASCADITGQPGDLHGPGSRCRAHPARSRHRDQRGGADIGNLRTQRNDRRTRSPKQRDSAQLRVLWRTTHRGRAIRRTRQLDREPRPHLPVAALRHDPDRTRNRRTRMHEHLRSHTEPLHAWSRRHRLRTEVCGTRDQRSWERKRAKRTGHSAHPATVPGL
jgi:fibronectin-binding autotransporter adhesin